MISIPNVQDVDLTQFFTTLGLPNLVSEATTVSSNPNILIQQGAYEPELDDLYVLYNLVTEYKRTTILEFGVGWSSLIFALALNKNKTNYENKVKNLRRSNPFELHSIDNEADFIAIAKDRIPHPLSSLCHFHYSNVNMTSFNGRYATEFEQLPLINPDFIYLDGPDQFNIKNNINGFTTAHNDMMPMSCDLLKIEHYLTPGTFIVADGRAANARFLLSNFQRDWEYQYTDTDQHIFYLNEDPLGEINKNQLNFYKSKN